MTMTRRYMKLNYYVTVRDKSLVPLLYGKSHMVPIIEKAIITMKISSNSGHFKRADLKEISPNMDFLNT